MHCGPRRCSVPKGCKRKESLKQLKAAYSTAIREGCGQQGIYSLILSLLGEVLRTLYSLGGIFNDIAAVCSKSMHY